MNQLAENLRAARALIDTPEKFAEIERNSPLRAAGTAIHKAIGNTGRLGATWRSYKSHQVRGMGFNSVMSQFDRAIENADQSA